MFGAVALSKVSLSAVELDTVSILTALQWQQPTVKVCFKHHSLIYTAAVSIEFEACSLPNSVRLSKSTIDNGGRLEVCSDGRWKSVCGTGVGQEIATVVCRQLNHAAAGVFC